MRFSKLAAPIPMFLLLAPAAIQPQIMPPQPPGKLNIYSQPPGAVVTINNKQQSQHTNAAFVVTPGNYTVSVFDSGTGKQLTCAVDGSSAPPSSGVQVSSGETKIIRCK